MFLESAYKEEKENLRQMKKRMRRRREKADILGIDYSSDDSTPTHGRLSVVQEEPSSDDCNVAVADPSGVEEIVFNDKHFVSDDIYDEQNTLLTKCITTDYNASDKEDMASTEKVENYDNDHSMVFSIADIENEIRIVCKDIGVETVNVYDFNTANVFSCGMQTENDIKEISVQTSNGSHSDLSECATPTVGCDYCQTKHESRDQSVQHNCNTSTISTSVNDLECLLNDEEPDRNINKPNATFGILTVDHVSNSETSVPFDNSERTLPAVVPETTLISDISKTTLPFDASESTLPYVCSESTLISDNSETALPFDVSETTLLSKRSPQTGNRGDKIGYFEKEHKYVQTNEEEFINLNYVPSVISPKNDYGSSECVMDLSSSVNSDGDCVDGIVNNLWDKEYCEENGQSINRAFDHTAHQVYEKVGNHTVTTLTETTDKSFLLINGDEKFDSDFEMKEAKIILSPTDDTSQAYTHTLTDDLDPKDDQSELNYQQPGYRDSYRLSSSSADSEVEHMYRNDTKHARRSLRKVQNKYEILLKKFEALTSQTSLVESELSSTRSCYDLVMKFKDELERELEKARKQLRSVISSNDEISKTVDDITMNEEVSDSEGLSGSQDAKEMLGLYENFICLSKNCSQKEGREVPETDNLGNTQLSNQFDGNTIIESCDQNNNLSEIDSRDIMNEKSPEVRKKTKSTNQEINAPCIIEKIDPKDLKWIDQTLSREKVQRNEKITLAAIENTEIKKELLLTKLEKIRLEAVLSCVMMTSESSDMTKEFQQISLNSIRKMTSSRSTLSSSASCAHLSNTTNSALQVVLVSNHSTT